ncbi:MAG: sodium:proton antiporter [Chitinophagaceae bacterium]
MNAYYFFVVLISLAAVFSYINTRFIKLPFVIGLFLLSTLLSILVISARFWYPASAAQLQSIATPDMISKVVLEVLLGPLLFAGALHTDWQQLRHQIRSIAAFALGGVLFSTMFIALAFYGIALALGIQADFIYCLLFGALISPTDPIAVLGILTKAGVPKRVESIIVGESLFNDGVGVVVFLSILHMLYNGGGSHFQFDAFGFLFLREAVGGILWGLGSGFLLHWLIRSIDHYETEVLLTLAFATGGYWLANQLHLSGPLAMVVMGLLTGNYKEEEAMNDHTRDYMHKFWELVDVILNAVLFILIAFVLLFIAFKTTVILLGLSSIIIVLLSRLVLVYGAAALFPRLFGLSRLDARIITWGGLRGGLSLAMVLSLPDSDMKSMLMVATYCCVLFSIIIQGLTIGRVAQSKP